ncbi:PaaI family thioesterase [Halopseudomonas pelagia]|uniref:Thioesterase n=1 Tax=Halopseudomonas pelagia TaxID=553151 RepID=A0AA91U1N0_9GAMM|nr:PaaI family thioesterase [Halopseudomonas pelagia]PCC99020.1 thioesterase [Halopseudomonas pelagia]QFY55388.1 PaaI family thioesterase [Halopseudomonas pelagia]
MNKDQQQAVERSVTGFFQDLGCELLEYSEGRAVVGLTLTPRHMNNAGNLHGGVTASLLDIAMGLCGTWAPTAEERRVAITLSLNVNFSATAQIGTQVRAVATCRSAGHKVFMAACDLLDENDKLIGFGEGVLKKGAYRKDLP